MASTTPEVGARSGWAERIVGSADAIPKVLLACAGAFLLTQNRRLGPMISEMHAQPGYRWWPWLLCQLLAFGAFLAISRAVFGHVAQVSTLSLWWLGAWAAAAAAAMLFLLAAAAPPRFWSSLVRREWPAALASIVVGIVAWCSGLLLQRLWSPLAEMTLRATHVLLNLIYPVVYQEPGTARLGTDSFVVEIGRQCSGYEGIALITVFLAVYLWLFRRELRFPQALMLLPPGIVLIWVANVLRITTLIAIGSSISPDIATNGFHSQAGWIAFSVTALGMIVLSHRLMLASRVQHRLIERNAALGPATALLTPLLVLLASSMIIAALSSGFALLYPFGVIATAAALWYCRAHYGSIERTWSWPAAAIGVAVFGVWILLERPDLDGNGGRAAAALGALPGWAGVIWVGFRIVGSVVTVPIAEELAFRGYLIRKLVAREFEQVSQGHFTWLSFAGSSVLFGLLHGNWLAGTLAGAGFAVSLYRRGQISDAIVSHMTANALIAAAVLGFGRWSLWA